MSRKSLLDEAITKAKEAEDWQLVEWLRMARGGESAARWYSDKLREAHRTERKLLDENAKLREQVASLIGRSFKTADKMDCLSAENESLRGLVRIMHSELVSCEDNGYICGGHKFDKRLRELGVEVDDA